MAADPEAKMGNKDKARRTAKKPPARDLKEKRAAKRAKRQAAKQGGIPTP